MRSSEEMAMVLFRAWAGFEGRPDVSEIEWSDLTEWEQAGYLAEVNAIMEYLFEHGRISAYLSHDHLETLKAEYRAYLASKNKENL